jgi:predicted ATPase
MAAPLSKITIRGFKSIRDATLELPALTLLIGGNGSGKSNFVQVFGLLNEIVQGNLQNYVRRQGGPEGLLHFGQKRTEHLILDLGFGQNGYRVQLAPSQDDSLFFEEEVCSFQGHGYPTPYTESLGSSHVESHLATEALRRPDKVASHVLRSMRSWKVYHFHDTGPTARVKQLCDIDDNGFLREDGANLAAFLWRLKESAAPQYAQILSTIRKVTPFFDEFQLREIPRSPEKTRLEWPVHLPCNAAASATTAGNRTPRRARAWPPPVCHPGSGELAAGRVPQNSGDRLNAVGNARKPVRA